MVCVLTSVVLVGCASLPASSPQAAAGTPSPSPTGTTIEAAAPTALPAQQLDAGTVGTGAPVTVTGTGPAVVDFVRGGDFGVVARVDCSACSGTFSVRDPDRDGLWGSGEAPLTGSYLVDVRSDDQTERSLVLDVQGSWSIELSSWTDLPVVTGAQTGTGATVLRLGDETGAVLLDFTPTDASDTLVGRAVPESDLTGTGAAEVLVFGSDDAVQGVSVPVPLPGVVAVSTTGTWSLAPVG